VTDTVDVVVVGAGVVGLGVALALTERDRRAVAVLEAEPTVAAHQSGRNSGVIHSGLYYSPGSRKAAWCREGLALLYRFCEAEGIPHRRTGKLIVAANPAELPRLDELAARASANRVAARRVSAAGLIDVEPAVAGAGGLWVEETGVVDFRAVARAIAARVQSGGGTVRFGSAVLSIVRDGAGFVVESTTGTLKTRRVVTCAGAQADRMARMTGPDPGVRIVTFRGEYLALKPERAELVRGLIYPVPDPSLPFLGVHFTRRIDGTVDVGPNALLTLARDGYRRGQLSPRDLAEWVAFPGFWKLLGRHWRVGAGELARSRSKALLLRSLRKLVPSLELSDLVPAPAGVRAQAVDRAGRLVSDFLFAEEPGVVHVLNAPSPAATACLAIGRIVADRVLAAG